MMHAIKGGWVGQTFALATSNGSGGRKARIRRSKEERKAMVESFIKKYQSSNDGTFPSLNLTHKEVGGSFYTVREIVREIIQENRVLGPAKLSLEEQKNDNLLEHYPLGSISIDPQTCLSQSDEIDYVSHIASNQNQGSSKKLVENSNGQSHEPKHQRLDSEQVFNGSIQAVKDEMGCDEAVETAVNPHEGTSDGQLPNLTGQFPGLDSQKFDNEVIGKSSQATDEDEEYNEPILSRPVSIPHHKSTQEHHEESSEEQIPHSVRDFPVNGHLRSDSEQAVGGTIIEEKGEYGIPISRAAVGEDSLDVEKDGSKLIEASNAGITDAKADIVVEKFPLRPVAKRFDGLERISEEQSQEVRTAEANGTEQDGVHVLTDVEVDADLAGQSLKQNSEPVDKTASLNVGNASLENSNSSTTKEVLELDVTDVSEIGAKVSSLIEVETYALLDGNARPMWEEIGGEVLILSRERYDHIDWSIFEGIIADSLEAKDAISSLMQEPFCSIPLIWIIQEDTLANRIQVYENNQWDHIISHWRNSFHRANVVVFPDYSLPMLYSVLDTGNFFVIPGSPIDVWAAESYSMTHSKLVLRTENGFAKDDLLVLVIGSSFFYEELSWDYAVAMHDLEPLLINYVGREEGKETFKFIFLCGNSSSRYDDALQDVASRLGLYQGSLWHYGIHGDVNGLILMSDIVLYGSSQDEQGFPPLLIRAMSFEIPVIAPEHPLINRYVADRVHGMIIAKHNPDAIIKAFSLLISDGKLSEFAHSIALSGKLLAKNMLASECIMTYAKLLENIFNFPSDVLLPGNTSQLKQSSWEWNFFQKEMDKKAGKISNPQFSGDGINPSVVYNIEEHMANLASLKNISSNDSEAFGEDFPTDLDWDVLSEMESSEELETLEMEEIEERMEKQIGDWDELYRDARKSEKLKFETNERDEGELERTGQPLCIYEIYYGAGAWHFLHHGSLYRGLSLSTRARRLRSDDVDAVARLPILNDTYFRDILCEIGGMFSIANGVDNIHKRPWIGFQSWRTAGWKAILSTKAEQVLEEEVQKNIKGDAVYFWAKLDMDGGFVGSNDVLTFWSMCDILNGGNCRTAFEDAFRRMYDLPSHVEALPPMPEDGGHWSALHSWVMPTPSFLEFIMFSRIFVDSLDYLHVNSSKRTSCLLGSSMLEKQHCYCRILELLVNVWAYHSARRMVYIDPHSGLLEEQHPIEQRKGFLWAKYFNTLLLKSMDEDLAEAADDNDHPYEMWLWPLTGEVSWQGIYEREREERYRLKMDKKRKTREKLLERMKYGYKQKTLGRLKR